MFSCILVPLFLAYFATGLLMQIRVVQPGYHWSCTLCGAKTSLKPVLTCWELWMRTTVQITTFWECTSKCSLQNWGHSLQAFTEAEMSTFWLDFLHWLLWKLSKWQLPVQLATKIFSKWRHFHFSVSVFILWGLMQPFQMGVTSRRGQWVKC